LRRVAGRATPIAASLALCLTHVAAATQQGCAWTLEPSADHENILFPDLTTRYLAAVLPVPPGGHIEISGDYPRARYMSLQTYSTTLQSASVLHDEQILPDRGSHNPYVPGASRRYKARHYTIRLLAGPEPKSGRPPNTLYDTSADGSRSGHSIAYRIYLPDRGLQPLGGVAAPKLTLVLANGTRIATGDCEDLLVDPGLTAALAGAGADLPLPALDILGYRKPVWHRYVNAPTTYALAITDNDTIGPALSGPVQQASPYLPSGLGENADNKYVYTFLSQNFGHVAVLRGTLPTTPRTYDGERRMGAGQLRYWSMCTGIRTTQTFGCLVDKDVHVDRHRRYEVVVSTTAGRPANAVPGCGIDWLPWGPDPQGDVVMRNMLPDPSFNESVQKAVAGKEAQTMGRYLPSVTYYADLHTFEKTGCRKLAPAAKAHHH
jgi:hypothetical protein